MTNFSRLTAAGAPEAVRASVTGEMAAGEIYSAPALAAVLGVSASPVREAMLEHTRGIWAGIAETAGQ